MNAQATRSDAIDFVAATLLNRASKLSRSLLGAGSSDLSRTEVGLLGTLTDGPHRITELAGSEALAQPSVTRVVNNLERRGLVRREHEVADRRVVLVTITEDGRTALEAVRATNRSLMRELLSDLDDEQVAQLASASDGLGQILETLQDTSR